jgi:dihydroorotate dehydrogenase (fumarate)
MDSLKTTYMGLELANPVVVGACSLSKSVDSIKKIEEAGAGALVIKSLFEEQVQLERASFEADRTEHDHQFPTAVTMFPEVEHAGPKEFLYWVEKTRKEVSLPLIASLNAVGEQTWVDYAKQLAETGVNGLELNFYSQPLDFKISGADIEKAELDIFKKVRAAVDIPIAVKLHAQYTSLFHTVNAFDRAGANAVVLFNRFFQPDINIETEEEVHKLRLTHGGGGGTTLRWTGLLSGGLNADIAASTGIESGEDAIKMILAGANAVQVVSALYRNGVSHIQTILSDMSAWMEGKGYKTISDFRGKLSKERSDNPWALERAQYVKGLIGFD